MKKLMLMISLFFMLDSLRAEKVNEHTQKSMILKFTMV